MSVTTETEFLGALSNLKRDAIGAKTQCNSKHLLKIREATRKLFEDNMDLAYSIGVENAMSYHNNDLREIDDLTGNFRNEDKLGWLPSSWDQC